MAKTIMKEVSQDRRLSLETLEPFDEMRCFIKCAFRAGHFLLGYFLQ